MASYNDAQQALIEKFDNLRSWEDRYRTIMRLGKSLPGIDAVLKVDSALLSGCESQVWFYASVENQQLHLCIDSDAKIVKGLISLIIDAFEGLSLQDITAFDCQQFLLDLGLFNHLSPSRGNGIKAIIAAIKQAAIPVIL